MALGAITSFAMWMIPASEVYLGIGVLFLCGFFVYGPQSSFWALCPDLAGYKRAGTAIGVMNFFAYLFAGLAEPLIGSIMDKSGDTSVVFMLVAISCAVSATVAAFIRR